MKVLFPERKNEKYNFGIIVPSRFPYNLISYLCWYSFVTHIKNLKPILLLTNTFQNNNVPWAYRLGIPTKNYREKLDLYNIDKDSMWSESFCITVANVFCLRKINFDFNYQSQFIKFFGKNESQITEGSYDENKCTELLVIPHIKLTDIAYSIINNNEVFDDLDTCNKNRFSKIVNNALKFKPLIEKEFSHEKI